jgi:hypothetical protein
MIKNRYPGLVIKVIYDILKGKKIPPLVFKVSISSSVITRWARRGLSISSLHSGFSRRFGGAFLGAAELARLGFGIRQPARFPSEETVIASVSEAISK